MKNLIKEIGIVPSILILIAIGVGSTSLINCNGDDACGSAGASCPGGTEACCEGLECMDERCCVSAGDVLTDEATADDCCSGSSKTTLSLDPAGASETCCVGEGEPAESTNCCNDLHWHLGTCYACVETGEVVPAEHVPCCDPDAIMVERRQADGTFITVCEPAPICPCGALPGSDLVGSEVRCREPCPGFGPDVVIPAACVPCDDPFDDPNCEQVIVTTEDYCLAPDAPGAACRLITVRADNREEAEVCAAALACEFYGFVTDALGECDARGLSAILLEAAGLPFETVHPMNTELIQQACRDYCVP